MQSKRLPMSFKSSYSKVVCIISVLLRLTQTVLSSCSGSSSTLSATDDISTLTSPGYSSGSYANGLSCSWLIDSGSSTDMLVILIPHYDVASPDIIVIHDGFSSNNSSLTAGSGLSGTGTHKDYTTTGQYALVLFTTDSSGQAQGFSLQYLKASDLSGTGCTSEQELTATSTDQYLTSPLFPNAYSGNSNCRWLIKAPEGTVSFQVFLSDIEFSNNCVFDYLKIYDSSYKCENTLTVDACTQYPGTTASYSSNGTSVLVLFVSDVSVGYKGFKLKYSLISSTTTVATTASASEGSSFTLGLGVGLATGIISTLMTIGIIQIIKSRLQASKLGSPRVRTVLPSETPMRIISSRTSLINGHLPNGVSMNGHVQRSKRFSVTSSQSSSGTSSRTGRTLSTGPNSPDYDDVKNKNTHIDMKNTITTSLNNNNDDKRNGMIVY